MTCFLKKMSRLSLILLLVLSYIPCSVNAVGTIDQNRAVSLKVSCKHEELPIEGMQFELYYVAEVVGYNKYRLAGDFTKYPVQLENLEASDWRALTKTLLYYTQADGITPLDKNKTDATGVVIFPSEAKTLSPGLYLVKAKPCVVGQYIYYAESFMICLPGTDPASGDWNYDVTVQAKCSKESPSYGTTNRKVLKIWKDERGENLPKALYPEKVVVKLWKNDTIYDIVTLNEANNWRHDWMNLPKYDESGVKIEWGLTEDPIDDYTVSVVLEQITFVVTNKQDSDTPVAPDSPGGPDSPDVTVDPGKPSLPQTGVLWWPVPVLAAAGLLFLITGHIMRGRRDA